MRDKFRWAGRRLGGTGSLGHTFRSQLAFRRRLLGFKSPGKSICFNCRTGWRSYLKCGLRWRTLAECRALRALNVWGCNVSDVRWGWTNPGMIHLIYKVLTVIVWKLLGPDHTMHVCLHEFLQKDLSKSGLIMDVLGTYLNEIDFIKLIERGWSKNIQYRYDVFVIEMTKELDLSKGA